MPKFNIGDYIIEKWSRKYNISKVVSISKSYYDIELIGTNLGFSADIKDIDKNYRLLTKLEQLLYA